jgi:hypothetical protein
VAFGGNAETEVDFRVAVPATRLGFTVQPSTTEAGAQVTPAVEVSALEASGTVDTSHAGAITVSLATGSGTPGASLGGSTTVAASGGVANFTDLSVDLAGTRYALDAVAAGLTSATSDSFDITAGGPVRLEFTAVPTSAVAGQQITPAVVVVARDAQGNVATGFTGIVDVAIVAGTGKAGAALSGTLSVTAASGSATFSDLVIDSAGTAYQLAASSTLPPDTSTAFDVLSGAATEVVLVAQPPTTAQSGVPFTQAPVAEVRDSLGNPLIQQGISVTATVATGPSGASLSNSVAATGMDGRATFSQLTIAGPIGTYTLDFAVPSLDSDTSTAVVLNPGAPAPTQTTATVPNGTAGSTTFLTIIVRDATGNKVPGEAGNLAVTVSGANAGAAVAAVTENTADTAYTTSYTPTVAGTDQLAITLGGTAISGSPYASAVSASSASAASHSSRCERQQGQRGGGQSRRRSERSQLRGCGRADYRDSGGHDVPHELYADGGRH